MKSKLLDYLQTNNRFAIDFPILDAIEHLEGSQVLKELKNFS